MKKIFKKTIVKVLLTIISVHVGLSIIFSCGKDAPVAHNIISMPEKLSEYGIFKGNPADLNPNPDFHLYELNSQLYTDYASKQRLIKVPTGAKLVAIDDNLLGFPDGTILVKTFFYFKDNRNPSAGKKIIETRILKYVEGVWNAGTYLWDAGQKDAKLAVMAHDTPISWISESGIEKSTTYHLPSLNECASCHNSGSNMMPIGLKARNLNRTVTRQGDTQNQLMYFNQLGIINPIIPSNFNKLPDYNNPNESIERRARAYLEMNCSHCHKKGGYNKNRSLFLGYEQSFEDANLDRYQDLIVVRMKEGKMPKLGKTIIHEEGLALISAYVDSLP